jgi:methylisocitrate lyase
VFDSNNIKKSLILRKLFERPGSIIAPGAYDALSAKLVEKSGFEVVQHSGYGTSASLLARPDVGLVDFTEMCRQVKNMARSVSIPVIGDADTGYGNVINVYRTVQEYIWAGAAALFIEDQVWPKKCGHMDGKKVINEEEIISKLKAAIKARNSTDPDFMLCFRTDSLTVNGLDDAIKRSKKAVELGVDYIFIEAIENRSQMQKIVQEINAPLMLNLIEGGRTPLVSVKEAEEMGFKLIVFSLSTLLSASKAMMTVLSKIKENTSSGKYNYKNELLGFEDFLKIVDIDQIKKIEQDCLFNNIKSE